MQWSPDRNAGFSSADFAQLYLPPLMDPVYGFQAVNVEQQRRDPSSFLHWLRRILAIRKQHPVLATGDLEVLHAENPSVLAYLRRRTSEQEASDEQQAKGRDDIVLCVHNLSRFPQPCELMLEQVAGKVPVELTGRVPFPRIGKLPYFVTLAPYGFYWFELTDQDDEEGAGG
jgi:maltose alpha-D-glucosyltransferase/alpha-amylase